MGTCKGDRRIHMSAGFEWLFPVFNVSDIAYIIGHSVRALPGACIHSAASPVSTLSKFVSCVPPFPFLNDHVWLS